MKTCLECKHAAWRTTPTGRIRKNDPGRCGAAEAMLKIAKEAMPNIPCVVVSHNLGTVCVWPHYDASKCPGHDPK